MAEAEVSGARRKRFIRPLLLVIGTFLVAWIAAIFISTESEWDARITMPQSPEQVWSVLTDYPSYGCWNSVMYNVTGDLTVGKQLNVKTKGLEFSPYILEVTPNRHLRWVGVLKAGGRRLGGFYEGEHRWILFLNRNGGTDMVQREDFRGLFHWAFDPTGSGRNGFEITNRDLAAEVARRFPMEGSSVTPRPNLPSAAGNPRCAAGAANPQPTPVLGSAAS